MTSSPSPSPAALDALTHRLLPLEFLLAPPLQPTSSPASDDDPPHLQQQHSHQPTTARRSVLARLRQLEQGLAEAARGHGPVERFVEDYDANLALLAPAFTLSSSADPKSSSGGGGGGSGPPSDPARLALLLALLPTLQAGAADLGPLTSLASHPRTLSLPPPSPAARQALPTLARQSAEAARTARALELRLARLVEGYDRVVQGVSETFLAVDEAVRACEARLAELERRRRQEGAK